MDWLFELKLVYVSIFFFCPVYIRSSYGLLRFIDVFMRWDRLSSLLILNSLTELQSILFLYSPLHFHPKHRHTEVDLADLPQVKYSHILSIWFKSFALRLFYTTAWLERNLIRVKIEAFLSQPVVYVVIYELVLSLGLDHAIALLSESSDNSKSRQFWFLSKWVFEALLMVEEIEHSLLQVVNGDQSACPTNASAAVEQYFVWTIKWSNWVLTSFINTCLVVLSHKFKDSLDDRVVLFLWGTMVGPR